jgi:hypothetical protein
MAGRREERNNLTKKNKGEGFGAAYSTSLQGSRKIRTAQWRASFLPIRLSSSFREGEMDLQASSYWRFAETGVDQAGSERLDRHGTNFYRR